MAQPIYVALDLETTGLVAEHDAIIEIAAVRFSGCHVHDTYHSFVNPRRPLPFQIIQLTGITDADLRGAPDVHQALPELSRFIGQHTLVGHNVQFDLSFLRSAGLPVRNRAIDTFALANTVFPHAERYSLGSLAGELGIPLGHAHRALDDADTTRLLFLALCERAEELPLPIIQSINQLARGTRWPLAPLFAAFERKRVRHAFTGSIGAQLEAKGRIAEAGSFGLLAQNEPVAAQAPTASPEGVSLDIDAMSALLEPTGLIAEHFRGYEHRPQQVAMLRAVAEALRAKEVLLVEAGTGTGKSLAYLIPAVHFAVADGKRAVVSTNTINLQDQLYQKDIPDLQQILPFEFRTTVLKGRSNYLCARKLESIQNSGQVSDDDVGTLARILVWAQTTPTGDQAELFLPTPTDRALWSRLSADSQSCLGDVCDQYQQRHCFLQRARQRAEAAHLLVVNHSLLLADVATENAILPEYHYLIIDEAHHLEAATTDQLSFEISQMTVDLEIALLAGSSAGSRLRGLVAHITAALSAQLPAPQRNELDRLAAHVDETLEDIRKGFQGLFLELDHFVNEQKSGDNDYGVRMRITDALRVQPAWSDIEILWDNLGAHIRQLRDLLAQLRQSLDGSEDTWALHGSLDMSRDLSARLEFWDQARAEISAILSNPRDNRVEWIEIPSSSGNIALHSAPLHVGDMINQHLLERRESVVMTSATMRVGDDFSFLRGRLGAGRGRELAVGSPFDYRSSTLLYFPTDVPEPATPYYQQAVSQAIGQVVEALHGRTLVLFTSYRQLRATIAAVGARLAARGIRVLEQGGGTSRAQLLQRFKGDEAAVLFGTRSFWEGIDVAGPALSCVIIVRLPFAVPSEPIFAARSESFEDPFTEYSVPDAVLRFRQGFGRLIRSKTDRGVVVVLDRRIFSKRYGQVFLRSLPTCTVERGPIVNLGLRAAQWVDGCSSQ